MQLSQPKFVDFTWNVDCNFVSFSQKTIPGTKRLCKCSCNDVMNWMQRFDSEILV